MNSCLAAIMVAEVGGLVAPIELSLDFGRWRMLLEDYLDRIGYRGDISPT